MKSITIVYTTARMNHKVHWFLDSLERQVMSDDRISKVVVVSFFAPSGEIVHSQRNGFDLYVTRPKPTIWQGEHRVTRENWWAKSNALNTGICLANGEWVCFVDDRCVLMPGWFEGIRDAMRWNYAVFGAYEKRTHMRVENGAIVESGAVIGTDNRLEYLKSFAPLDRAHRCDGGWCYGCTVALPLEWALDVGGFEQALDGMSAEDTAFGRMLYNRDLKMCYDPRMMMVEDRTPGQSGEVFRREDKGKSPLDKSHAAIARFGPATETTNRAALLESRREVQAGRPFPVILDPCVDWYDGEPIDADYYQRPSSRLGYKPE